MPNTLLPIKEQEIYIPVADGTKLAARIWLPTTAEQKPVPAVLEYIPYRKRDGTRIRDESIHPHLARKGYACVRVDMRGSGDSEGIQEDEYLPIEQQDGLDVINWLADQNWCSGSVGMFGISWGGITTFQLASHQPEALKAIVPVGASVDRYYDDACYFVGGYSGETIGWGGVMFGYNGRPADPEIFGDGWLDNWISRMKDTPLYLKKWLEHQRRDEYWKQGSACEAYSRIEIPVYAITGWTDCWPNTVLRVLENLKGPRKGLLGPWGHVYPNAALPGPGIDFVNELGRWFDRWLKDIDNGIDRESMLTSYIQDEVPIDPCHEFRPGRWVGSDIWPPSNATEHKLYFGEKRLQKTVEEHGKSAAIQSPQSLGYLSGDYMPVNSHGKAAQMPANQQLEDANSLCFDGEVLTEQFQIIGTSYVHLEVETDSPSGLVAVRLCDVAPDGTSALITYGLLNLAQREGRESPLEVEAGKPYKVKVRLNDIGHRFAVGRKLRLAVSNSMWPMACPTPDRSKLKLHLENCFVILPQAELPDCGADIPTTKPAPPSDTTGCLVEEEGENKRVLEHDLSSGLRALTIHKSFGENQIKSANLNSSGFTEDRFEILDDDPLSAKAQYKFSFGYKRDGWNVVTSGNLNMRCDYENFYIKGQVNAYHNEEEVFTRHWDEIIKRDGF